MPYLIEHPEHGRMHVYSALELQAHIAIGWKLVTDKPEPKKRRSKQ